MRLSTDPQSVAARERRHRISDRFKILQSLIPGGSKLDTVSMLEKAIQYVKFLKTQIWLHETMINTVEDDPSFIFLPSQRSFFPETSLPTIEPSPTLQVQECFCQADHEILMFSDVLENYYYHEPSNIWTISLSLSLSVHVHACACVGARVSVWVRMDTNGYECALINM